MRSSNDGRLDYIETLSRWGKAIQSLYTTWKIFPALGAAIPLLRFLPDPGFRAQIEFARHSGQTEIFKRGVFYHKRMLFEKVR
jgi:hypothetical protein